jgi:putative transposase
LAYLDLLGDHARRFAIDIAAYCLMPNHVHLVVIPSSLEGLHRMFKGVHGLYAQRLNRMKEQQGHLWQGRYFSSPLDSDYFLNAVRYVELNPVRARMVAMAEDYAWSSAAAHCGLRKDPLVALEPRPWLLAGISNWSRWLAEGFVDDALKTLRQHGGQNLPCGSSQFIAELEKSAGRQLRFRPRGGQRNSKLATDRR